MGFDLGQILGNIGPLAKLAYTLSEIEDPAQLAEDGITLMNFVSKYEDGTKLPGLTEAELNSAIPALSRTGITIGNAWGNPKNRPLILAAMKGL